MGLAAATGTRNPWPQAWREGGGVPYTNPRPRPRRGRGSKPRLNSPCPVARRGPGVRARRSDGRRRQRRRSPRRSATHRVVVRRIRTLT
ncbi:hypothetical protein PVAP13_4NG279538 [Panicum virgatum]|uniref:Uncharacterized protein n=1 Tax=Panicum virgatum TaxID=38727 RepID=A0A8T0THQ1_PANVG|nr:hypothetical protein PVAP13_4NG279538 [Panicum virgatum]